MDINIGDKVMVTSSCDQSIQTVAKIMSNGNIRLSNGTLYSPSGYEIGTSAWVSSTIKKVTPDLETLPSEEDIVNKALKVMHDIKDLSYENAVKILNILNDR